jgi:poly(A) polymerase
MPAPDALRHSARQVVLRLQTAGHRALWAGGCVRDEIMGRAPKDYDIATSARPDQIEALFEETRSFGRAFGVVQVVLDGCAFEVATFRKDREYEDGRRPSSVEFSTAEEDARRRDFTINGLFYDPLKEVIIDFVDGQADIRRRVIRTIGRPEDRFQEDYLRMLRAVRFAACLEFDMDPETSAAIRRNARNIGNIAAERIQQELTRLLMEAPKPGGGVRLLDEVGLLDIILPEVARMKGVAQPPKFHPEGDVFTHTMLMLDAMENRSPTLVYAVLFHDVAKPLTYRVARESNGEERIRFDGHDKVGADLTVEIMKRLRFSNDLTEDVARCVRNHMRFIAVPEMRESTLRQMVGAPTYPVELELHRVDCLSSHGDLGNYEFLKEFEAKPRSTPALPPPWITGHDIMALGISEGPEVGRWRKRGYEAQLEGRFTDREEALAWLRREMAAR